MAPAPKLKRDHRVGIRDLKATLSAHLTRVKNGESLTITEHGRPVAQIYPYKPAIRERIEHLLEAGILSGGPGLPFRVPKDHGPIPKGGNLADLLIADRKR